MNVFADRYQFRARIIPSFFTALPILICSIIYVDSLLTLGFLSFALFFIFFQGHFSARSGRELEKKLKKEGKLLSNSKYLLTLQSENPDDKYIKLLIKAADKAGEESPFLSDDDEEKKKKIDHIIRWLIEHTRDKDQFPAVFDKLCDYGYGRNMLALKIWALCSTIIALIILLHPKITFQYVPSFSIYFSPLYLGNNNFEVGSIWIILGFFWIYFLMEMTSLKELQKANIAYLETLLNAATSVEGSPKTKTKEFNV
jgi:hypothetical protein